MTETLPRSDDLDATWNFIQPSINKILGSEDDQSTKRINKVLSPTMYIEVYTAIYIYCVNRSRSSRQFNSDRSTKLQIKAQFWSVVKFMKDYKNI